MPRHPNHILCANFLLRQMPNHIPKEAGGMFHLRDVRLSIRSTVVLAVAAAVMGLVASAALAGSPHGVHAVTVTQSGNTVTASGKEAGLGGEAQVHIVLSATAECING